MTTITMRTLSRETARILDELRDHGNEVVVTRDGEDVAVLTPLSPIEIALRSELRRRGADPDVMPPIDPALRRAPGRTSGEPSISDHLKADRDSYYEVP